MKWAFLLGLVLAVASCSSKPKTAYDILQSDSFWTLAYGDAFADGGSFSLSFISSDGDIIHLWAQVPSDELPSPGKFFLKRTYNDPAAVEIIPGSPVEQSVLNLLGTYQRRSQIAIPDSYPQNFAALLRDRNRPFPSLEMWSNPPK